MSAEIVTTTSQLPVPVLSYPHWRVNFRPGRYEPELVPTRADCLKLVEQCQVSLRGWSFPFISNRQEEREFGENYVASWVNFMGEIEYWRFYQSAQFLHLHAIEESLQGTLRSQLEATAQSHFTHLHVDWNRVGGFLSLMNFFYRIIEIVEFATRLCQKDVYKDQLTMSIELKRIKNFVLITNSRKSWSYELWQCKQESLGHSWTLPSAQLVATSAQESLKVAKWFFEGFGWLDPSDELLRREQENFLAGRL